MWISQIQLRNFRPFYAQSEPIVVTFPPESKTSFSVIEAKSDVGKTTFLSAIAWCLYGEDSADVHDHSQGPFSIERSQEMTDKELDQVMVEIVLNDQSTDEPVYVIRREAMFQKIGGELAPLGESKLYVEEWEENDCRPIPDYSLTNVINGILPKDIYPFFMFEGEKLEKHFSLYNKEHIKNAIERTSQIKQIKTGIKHLQDVRDNVWTSDEGEIDERLLLLQNEIASIEDYVTENTKKVETLRVDLGEAESEIQEIDSFLQNHSAALINELSKRERSLADANATLLADLKKFQGEYRDSVLEKSPLAMMAGVLKSTLYLLEEEKKKDELEPNIQSKYLLELLKQKKCVCGRSLDPKNAPDADYVDLLKRKLQANAMNDLKELRVEMRVGVGAMMEKTRAVILEELPGLDARIRAAQATIEKNSEEILDIQKRLSGVNEAEIGAKVSRKSALRTAADSQREKIARLEAAMKMKEPELVQKRENLDKLGSKKEGSERKKRTAEFLDRAIDHLKEMESAILSEVRKKVEERTWLYFHTLHWDKEKYREFYIGGDYALSLLDAKNTDWIHDMATGPKQLLLLSFIAALSEISGFKFPVFIDTPLANIDNEQRENVAKFLPAYLQNSQVVLLMKDQEYTPTIRKLFGKRVAIEYRFVRTNGRTEVRPWA